MTDCITHFFSKGVKLPRTGTIPPLPETPRLHPVPDLTAQVWGVFSAMGDMEQAQNIAGGSRRSRGVYLITFAGDAKNSQYIVSAYGDERPNYRRLGEHYEVTERTKDQFVIKWRRAGALVDTDFSVAVY